MVRNGLALVVGRISHWIGLYLVLEYVLPKKRLATYFYQENSAEPRLGFSKVRRSTTHDCILMFLLLTSCGPNSEDARDLLGSALAPNDYSSCMIPAISAPLSSHMLLASKEMLYLACSYTQKNK